MKTSPQEVAEKKERMKIAFCWRLALSARLKVGGWPGMRVGCYPFTLVTRNLSHGLLQVLNEMEDF